jgi:hypothetical protein
MPPTTGAGRVHRLNPIFERDTIPAHAERAPLRPATLPARLVR